MCKKKLTYYDEIRNPQNLKNHHLLKLPFFFKSRTFPLKIFCHDDTYFQHISEEHSKKDIRKCNDKNSVINTETDKRSIIKKCSNQKKEEGEYLCKRIHTVQESTNICQQIS